MLRNLWNLLLHKLAVDPIWAIVLGAVFGGGGVTWLGWLDGLPWAAKITYGLLAAVAVMLLIIIPQYFHARTRSARRVKMSDAILSLIRQGHTLEDGAVQHTAWQQKVEDRLRQFDPIWANDFASLKYRMDKGEILKEERTKLGIQLVSLREDKDVY